MVGPHDAAALSDKITIVSFIEDGVAQEVKRRVDIEAAAMTDLQLRLKLSIQYHSIYVAACAVRPDQVQHAYAERTSPQRRYIPTTYTLYKYSI